MINKTFLKEIPRDFVALGGLVFFSILLVRVSILSNWAYFSQFLIGGFLFLVLIYLFKANLQSGLALIMLVFTVLLYNDFKFTAFAILMYIGLIASLIYLKEDKNRIIKGVVLGVISSLVSYYAVELNIF